MIYCPWCGRGGLRDGVEKCPYCGYPIGESMKDYFYKKKKIREYRADPPKPPKNHAKALRLTAIILWAVGIALMLVSLCLFLTFEGTFDLIVGSMFFGILLSIAGTAVLITNPTKRYEEKRRAYKEKRKQIRQLEKEVLAFEEKLSGYRESDSRR